MYYSEIKTFNPDVNLHIATIKCTYHDNFSQTLQKVCRIHCSTILQRGLNLL